MSLLGYEFRKYFLTNEQRTTNNEQRTTNNEQRTTNKKRKFVVHPLSII